MSEYIKNFSTEEFLATAFILLKRKVDKLYELSQLEQSVEVIKSRFEKTSEILEALRLMNSSIDFKLEGSEELSNYYIELQQIIFNGNSSNPELLKNLFKV